MDILASKHYVDDPEAIVIEFIVEATVYFLMLIFFIFITVVVIRKEQ